MTIIDYIVLFLMFLITLLIHDLLLFKKESKESKTLKLKKVPAHVKQFADPLGDYDSYKDKRSNLYNTYATKREKRRE